MSSPNLILDHMLDHEARQPDRIFLTQPLGQGRVADCTWAQVLDQSRRMAAHLQARGFARGARIARRCSAREVARQGKTVLVNVWLDKTEFREGSLSM